MFKTTHPDIANSVINFVHTSKKGYIDVTSFPSVLCWWNILTVAEVIGGVKNLLLLLLSNLGE